MTCWTGWASAIFALIAFIFAGYLIRKKESMLLWLPIIYFGLMESLQALTYPVIGSCALPANQILTVLLYIHIAFQPIFISMFILYFMPENVRKKISIWVYSISALGAIIAIIILYPFSWATMCEPNTIFTICGPELCAFKGTWNIAWTIPFIHLPLIDMLAYTFPVFILPWFYGAWRLSLYLLLSGPILAILLSSNPNERPAVWCLFAVAIILLVFIKPLREWFKVRKWYFWDFPFKKPKTKSRKKRKKKG